MNEVAFINLFFTFEPYLLFHSNYKKGDLYNVSKFEILQVW